VIQPIASKTQIEEVIWQWLAVDPQRQHLQQNSRARESLESKRWQQIFSNEQIW
jgi:hypothetical protein